VDDSVSNVVVARVHFCASFADFNDLDHNSWTLQERGYRAP